VVVLYIGLLLSFFWETLTLSVVAYFVLMPFGVRSYRKAEAQHIDRQRV